jgi:hypothetical protein
MISDSYSFTLERSKLRSREYFFMYSEVTSYNLRSLASLFSPSHRTRLPAISFMRVLRMAESHFLKILDWF